MRCDSAFFIDFLLFFIAWMQLATLEVGGDLTRLRFMQLFLRSQLNKLQSSVRQQSEVVELVFSVTSYGSWYRDRIVVSASV